MIALFLHSVHVHFVCILSVLSVVASTFLLLGIGTHIKYKNNAYDVKLCRQVFVPFVLFCISFGNIIFSFCYILHTTLHNTKDSEKARQDLFAYEIQRFSLISAIAVCNNQINTLLTYIVCVCQFQPSSSPSPSFSQKL